MQTKSYLILNSFLLVKVPIFSHTNAYATLISVLKTWTNPSSCPIVYISGQGQFIKESKLASSNLG